MSFFGVMQMMPQALPRAKKRVKTKKRRREKFYRLPKLARHQMTHCSARPITLPTLKCLEEPCDE